MPKTNDEFLDTIQSLEDIIISNKVGLVRCDFVACTATPIIGC
jgi:hypothetical protein